MIGVSTFSTFLPRLYSQTFVSCRTLVTSVHNQVSRPLLLGNITSQNISTVELTKPNSIWSLDAIRTIMRNHFPYPRETKRVKTHGFKKRMSTRGGRAVLMRRILKGRHVLCH